MGILYQTDEQGKRLAVVVPIAERVALQARLSGDAYLSPKDEQDRRVAHDALAKGDVLNCGKVTIDWWPPGGGASAAITPLGG